MAQRFITLILLLCSTSVFAGLFDAPGRLNFIPADQAFVFDFQQNQHDLSLTAGERGYYHLSQAGQHHADKGERRRIADARWRVHEDEFYGKSEIAQYYAPGREAEHRISRCIDAERVHAR